MEALARRRRQTAADGRRLAAGGGLAAEALGTADRGRGRRRRRRRRQIVARCGGSVAYLADGAKLGRRAANQQRQRVG